MTARDTEDPNTGFLDVLIRAVQADARFEALLIGGAHAHGQADAFSDLDAIIVCADDTYPDVLAERTQFAESLGELVSCFPGFHGGEPRLLICLYRRPLAHIDLKFVVGSDLASQVEEPRLIWARDPERTRQLLAEASYRWPNQDPQWFEDRAWVWLHYGITKLQRGELYEAIGMLGFFREQVLGPLLNRRAGRNQRGVRRIEQARLDPADALSSTLAGHDPDEVRRALQASMACYLELRADEPPARPCLGMPDELAALLEASESRSGLSG